MDAEPVSVSRARMPQSVYRNPLLRSACSGKGTFDQSLSAHLSGTSRW